MIITLTRTGGFTGIPIRKTIDTSKLPKEQAEKIEKALQLIQKQKTNSQSSIPIKSGSIIHNQSNDPDRFTYSISLQNGAINQEIKIPENSLTQLMKELLQILQET